LNENKYVATWTTNSSLHFLLIQYDLNSHKENNEELYSCILKFPQMFIISIFLGTYMRG
jgi:hypothetical protein